MQYYILEEWNTAITCFTPLCCNATSQFTPFLNLHSYFQFNALCLVYLSHCLWEYHISFMPSFLVLHLVLDILSYTSAKISKLLVVYYILWNVCSNIGIWIGTAVSSGECFNWATNDAVRPIYLDECEENFSSFNRCSKLFLVSGLCIE